MKVTFTFWLSKQNIHFLAAPKQTKGCSLIKTKFTSKTVSKPTAVNTEGQLSSRCYPTVNRLWANCQAGAIQQSTDCGPTVKQVLSNSQQTVGQLSSRCYPTVNRLWANCQAGAIQLSTDCGPTVKQVLSNGQQTVGQLSSRCYPTVNRLWANCQAGAIQWSTDWANCQTGH